MLSKYTFLRKLPSLIGSIIHAEKKVSKVQKWTIVWFHLIYWDRKRLMCVPLSVKDGYRHAEKFTPLIHTLGFNQIIHCCWSRLTIPIYKLCYPHTLDFRISLNAPPALRNHNSCNAILHVCTSFGRDDESTLYLNEFCFASNSSTGESNNIQIWIGCWLHNRLDTRKCISLEFGDNIFCSYFTTLSQ